MLGKKSKISVIALASAAIFGCGGETPTPTYTYTYMTVDVPNSTTGETLDLMLKVKPPADGSAKLANGKSPVLMFVHGGYWNSGNFDDAGLSNDMTDASDRGYLALSINYRLIDANGPDGTATYPWPAQIQDVKCAIRWVRNQASQPDAPYDIDTDHIAVAGVSAGGHLALMAGETAGIAEFEADECGYSNVTSEANAVITYAGVADIPTFWETNNQSSVLALLGHNPAGAVPANIDAEMEYINPATYVQPSNVPVLMMHAQDDILVTDETSKTLLSVLQNNGRDAFLFNPPTGNHTFSGGIRDKMDCVMHAWLDEKFWGIAYDESTLVSNCDTP